MPRYMIERDFGEAVEEDMARIGSNSKRILEDDFPDMTWEHSYVVSDESRTSPASRPSVSTRLRTTSAYASTPRFGEHAVTLCTRSAPS